MTAEIGAEQGSREEVPPSRRTIIGVMGSSSCDEPTADKARQLGHLLAKSGYAVLCGGGSGVMEAVSRGASEAGGLTIGVLPGRNAQESPPNPFIQIPIYSGISYARNFVNVLSSRVVVAVAGAHGTLSEIALALACDKPVVLLDSWQFEVPGGVPSSRIYRADSPEHAVRLVNELLEPSSE